MRHVIAVMFGLFVASPAVQAANAAPFGLELGVATCAQTVSKLGAKGFAKGDARDGLVEAEDPASLYPNASEVTARCLDGKLAALNLQIGKGGMASPASREAYANLSKKYKLKKGGPMPSLGDGYALFVQDASVIEQSAPHLSFSFSVTYFTAAFYNAIKSDSDADRQRAQAKKDAAL